MWMSRPAPTSAASAAMAGDNASELESEPDAVAPARAAAAFGAF